MALGSLLGGTLAGTGIAPQWSAAAVSLIVLPGAMLLVRSFPEGSSPQVAGEAQPATGLFIPGLVLLGICVVALGSNLLEGVSADWSAVYLTSVFGATGTSAGLGYATYALTMAVGRFAGDWLRTRWGSVTVVRACYALATIGVLVMVASPVYPFVLLGYALAGFGGSVGVPLAISAAASLGDRPPATNVAMVTLISLIGFLCAPPIVGVVAQQFGLRVGIGLLLLPVLVASILVAETLRRRVAN